MRTEAERIESMIRNYREYKAKAKNCWDLYKDIEQASYMFDYYSDMAKMFEDCILLVI